jgi:hypothetical protein
MTTKEKESPSFPRLFGILCNTLWTNSKDIALFNKPLPEKTDNWKLLNQSANPRIFSASINRVLKTSITSITNITSTAIPKYVHKT